MRAAVQHSTGRRAVGRIVKVVMVPGGFVWDSLVYAVEVS